MYGRTQALAQAICAAARQSCAASTSGMYSSEALNTLGKVRFVSSAQEYARKRAQHAAELSELRKEWAKEYAQQQALKAAKREAEKTAADSRHARQRGTEVKVKQQKAAASQEELSAHKQQRIEEKKARARRQLLRQDVLNFAREEREAALLETSRHWISPEDLEAAVLKALDNPVPLAGQS